MKKTLLILTLIAFNQVLFAQIKTFNGAWFEINYPSSFTAKGSLKSSTSDGFESAFFESPDNLVEFYVFSPQWSGDAEDILLTSKETLNSSKSQINGDEETKWWTITANDGSYQRSYQEKSNKSQNVNWIIGVKYRNSAALEKYKKEYASFKNSIIQYAD